MRPRAAPATQTPWRPRTSVRGRRRGRRRWKSASGKGKPRGGLRGSGIIGKRGTTRYWAMPWWPLSHKVHVSVARCGIWPPGRPRRGTTAEEPAGVYGTRTWAARDLRERASAACQYAAARARAVTRGLTGRDGHQFFRTILTGCKTGFWSKPVSDASNRFKSADSVPAALQHDYVTAYTVRRTSLRCASQRQCPCVANHPRAMTR